MNNEFRYRSDDYDRATQRFVIPLYIKDDLGGYNFSSTGTLIKYDGFHYIIFAAHALRGSSDFETIHTIYREGTFCKIRECAIGHEIYDDEDIVVVDCFNNVFDGKKYFNINLIDLTGFEEKYFAWIGFPASKSKAKTIHRSKSKEALQEQFIVTREDGYYFKSVDYLIIISELKSYNEIEITGCYDRKDTELKYAGRINMGPKPDGMSGGAMYFFRKGQQLGDNLDDTFRFAGIGIEYRKDNTIAGVSRMKIIELIEKFKQENPLRIIFVDPLD